MELASQIVVDVLDGNNLSGLRGSHRKSRPYVARVNHGGNFCGHQTDSPRLDLNKPQDSKRRPGILIELQERIRRYYSDPSTLPSLRNANKSKQGRKQRSERREACLALLAAILEHTDLVSLRCGVPTPSGFMSLTLPYLVKLTGLHPRRAERAMADLKQANLLTVNQPRQLKEDGSWRGLAAVKAVNKLLFAVFGLAKRLKHEKDRAAERLAKKVKKAGGTLTSWARNALVIGGAKQSGALRVTVDSDRPPRKPPIDDQELQRVKIQLQVALMQAHPDWKSQQINAEVDRVLAVKFKQYGY